MGGGFLPAPAAPPDLPFLPGYGGAGGGGGLITVGTPRKVPGGTQGGGGSSPTPTSGATSASLGSFLGSPLGYLFGPSLLRFVIFVLGLICIIGAIYLYKDTRFIVTAPVKAAKKAATTAATAAGAAA